MRKIIFSTTVVLAFALLAAVALSTRPDATAADAAQAANTDPNIETSVVQETVRVRPSGSSGQSPASSSPRVAGAAGSAQAPATAPRSFDRDDDDDRHEGDDDDRHGGDDGPDGDDDHGVDRDDDRGDDHGGDREDDGEHDDD